MKRVFFRSFSPVDCKAVVVPDHGRLRYPFPRSGPLHVFLRATRYVSSNALTNINHAVDVYKKMNSRPPVLCLLSDNFLGIVRCVGANTSCAHCKTLGPVRATEMMRIVAKCCGNFPTPPKELLMRIRQSQK